MRRSSARNRALDATARPMLIDGHMRTLALRIALGAIFYFTSCAHESPVAVTTGAVLAYRAVRTGKHPVTIADGIEFCAADDGVEAMRTISQPIDDWADKFEDGDLRQEVHAVVFRDPTLAAQPIAVAVDQGEAFISGHVRHDGDVVAAARDALAVPGIIAVRLDATSAETPAQPALVAASCQ